MSNTLNYMAKTTKRCNCPSIYGLHCVVYLLTEQFDLAAVKLSCCSHRRPHAFDGDRGGCVYGSIPDKKSQRYLLILSDFSRLSSRHIH